MRLLAGLSLGAAVIAASVSVACLIRIEDLHREWAMGRQRRRRSVGGLHGRGKIVQLWSDPPPRR